MIFLFWFLVFCEVIRYLELRQLIRFAKEKAQSAQPVRPPKARGSFVVKRMEERLKQAMYPEE